MKEKRGLIVNVGTPSILVILVVFVLAVFAILSIGASSNELKLAAKTGASVKEYYEADQKVEVSLCYLDKVLQDTEIEYLEQTLVGMEATNREDMKGLENVVVKLEKDAMFAKGKAKKIGTVSYEFLIRKDSYLNVSIALYSDRSYQVEQRNVSQTYAGSYELDDSVELWDGSVTIPD